MTQQTIWTERKNRLIGELATALASAMLAEREPLADATTIDGEEVSAETTEDRALIVFDELQAALVYALLGTAPDHAQLLSYVQFAAKHLAQQAAAGERQWVQLLPVEALGTLPGELYVHWSIRPEQYFAGVEAKKTL